MNIRTITLSILIAVLLAVSMPIVLAQEDHTVHLYVFYGAGCPHCGDLFKFLDKAEDKYPSLMVHEFEVYHHSNNVNIFNGMAQAYETQIMGVPTTFIGSEVIPGFIPRMGAEFEEKIKKCIADGCESPGNRIGFDDQDGVIISPEPKEETDNQTGGVEIKKKLSLAAVISGAAIDAINPCAFAVLIILLTTVLSAGVRRKAFYSGLAFTLAIYISYFAMGLGLYAAIGSIAGRTLYTIVGILAIILGLLNLKDYFWYGKVFIMEVPRSWRPAMKRIITGVTSVPGAFITGFIVSIFLLPCTSGPYIVILGLLANLATKSYAVAMLLLYNAIFVLPMILITLAISCGLMTVERAERWRNERVHLLHLIAGIILLVLGIGLFIAMHYGII